MRSVLSIAIALCACQPRHEPQPRNQEGSGSGSASAPAVASGKLDQLSRADFNRFAVRQDLPIYWVDDTNHDRAVEADEVVPLLFYPQPSVPLADAYAKIVAASKAPPASDPRLALVEKDLDGGVPTLVRTDLRGVSPAEHAFAQHMLAAAILIDHMYEQQNGEAALASQVPADPESKSLFERDRGPKCATPGLDRDPKCSAIPGSPKPIVDVYPAAMQASETFCKDLEGRPDAKDLLGPFTVVRDQAGKLAAVPYSEAYKDDIAKLRTEL